MRVLTRISAMLISSLINPHDAGDDQPICAPPLVRKLSRHARVTAADAAALGKLLDLNVRLVRARTTFIELGSTQAEISVMVQGWACRYKLLPDGRRQIVAFHLPGDVCDFNALLTEAADTGTEAIGDVRVAGITKQALARLTAEHPRISQALWWESLASASVQREWLTNVCRRNALERMAHLFCELYARLEAAGQDGQAPLPLAQVDLANACGMTSEHANRTLRSLRVAGLVSLQDRKLAIASPDGLAALAGFDPAYLHFGRSNATATEHVGAAMV